MNVLIPGASSGIGETIARVLAENGHNVTLMARRADKLEAIATDINASGPGKAVALAGDVSVWGDCDRAVDEAEESFGSLDALVNVAGAWRDKPMVDIDPADIRHFVDTDVTGALQITRAVLPVLRDSGGGRVIHVNGIQGTIRQQAPVIYASVEAAVVGMCEGLRWEAADYGVHVGLIILGAVANQEAHRPDESVLMMDGKRDRLGRGEVADAVHFMLTRPKGVNVDSLMLTPLAQRERW